MAMALGKYMAATSIVGGDDDGLPWCDADIISNCEIETFKVEKSQNLDERDESFMRLSWALVHSRLPVDVKRGISMLLASSSNSTSLQKREKLYLLALGQYRTGSYKKSRHFLEECLEIETDWEQALILQKLLTERTKRDGAIGMMIATGTIGIVGFAVAGVMGAVGAVAVAAGGVIAMARLTEGDH